MSSSTYANNRASNILVLGKNFIQRINNTMLYTEKIYSINFSATGSICNNKQRWNEDTCRCECKELIDKEMCHKGFIWNPSSCECECDKSCDIGEYLDYKNCNCRKIIIDKLVEECSENIDGKY